MTLARFRTARARGTGLVLPTVDALLDALDAGRLGPDDFVFDAELQTWLRAREHPELRAAWEDRQRYQPHDRRTALDGLPDARLAYPVLDDVGVTPARGISDEALESRRAAFRALLARPVPHAVAPSQAIPLLPAVPARRPLGESLVGHAALALALVLLGLVGWSIVGLATGIGKLMSLGAWGK